MNRSLAVKFAMSRPAGASSCDAAASFARASRYVVDSLMDALLVASIIILAILALIAMICGQRTDVLSVVAVVLAVVVGDEKKNT